MFGYLAFATSGVAAGIAVWSLVRTGDWHLPGPAAFSDTAGGISSLVTALAVLAGGAWAYFKFVRGRIYHPRSAIEVKAQWHKLAGVGDALQVRISVTNFGSSKLTLELSETGVQVDLPAEGQTTADDRSHDEWWADIRWEPVKMLQDQDQARTFTVLTNHAFIEPGEQVIEDILLNLGRKPTICRIRAQLCWEAPGLSRQKTWLYDYVDQIIPTGTVIYKVPEND